MRKEEYSNLKIKCWKGKLIIWGSMNLLLAVFCMILVCAPVKLGDYELWARLFGAVAAGYFLWKAVFQLHTAMEQEFLLKMDENGLEDHSSPYACGCMIPWENIAAIKVKSVLFEKYIAIELKPNIPALNGMHWTKRLLIHIRRWLGYSALSISISSMGGRAKEVLESAQFYMERKQVQI